MMQQTLAPSLIELYIESIEQNGIETIRDLVSHAERDINEQDEIGNTLLHACVILLHPYFGEYSTERCANFFMNMDALMAMGANPIIKNNERHTCVSLFFSDSISILKEDKLRAIPQFIALFKCYCQYSPEILSVLTQAYALDPTLELLSPILRDLDLKGLSFETLQSMLDWLSNDVPADKQWRGFRENIIRELNALRNQNETCARKFMEERYAQYQQQDKLTRHALFAELLQRSQPQSPEDAPSPSLLKLNH